MGQPVSGFLHMGVPLPEVPVVAGLGCWVEDGLHKAGLPVSSLAPVSEQNGIRWPGKQGWAWVYNTHKGLMSEKCLPEGQWGVLLL